MLLDLQFFFFVFLYSESSPQYVHVLVCSYTMRIEKEWELAFPTEASEILERMVEKGKSPDEITKIYHDNCWARLLRRITR